MCAQLAGDTDDAEARATEALRIGTDSGQPDASAIYGAQLGPLMAQRGTAGELIPLIEQLAAELPELTEASDGGAGGDLRRTWADSRTRITCWNSSQQPTSSSGPTPGPGFTIMTTTPTSASPAETPTIAATLFDRLEPFADQVPTNFIVAYDPVSHYLGDLATVLGRYDQADAYYAHAAQFNDRAGAKFFAANTNLAWGKMLIERDAPGDARTGSTTSSPPPTRPPWPTGTPASNERPPKHSNTSIGTDRCR